MIIRSGNKLTGNHGYDNRRAATVLTTPFIHFSGGENNGEATGDRFTNYGNIGESTFEYAGRLSLTARNGFQANAPWLIGEQAGAFYSTCLYFPTEPSDVDQMMNISNEGAMLFFGRVKITDNAYEEGIWGAGNMLAGGPTDVTQYLKFTGNGANDLSYSYRAQNGSAKTVTVMATGGLPKGGAEHRILLLVDRVNLQVICMVNEANITTVTGLDPYVSTSMVTPTMGISIGDESVGTTAGARASTGLNYLGGDYRDFSFFNVTNNVDKVVTNFQAIADAFGSAPEGFIPDTLKDLIE